MSNLDRWLLHGNNAVHRTWFCLVKTVQKVFVELTKTAAFGMEIEVIQL